MESQYNYFVKHVKFEDWCLYGQFLIWRKHAKDGNYNIDDYFECENWRYGGRDHMAFNYEDKYNKWKSNVPDKDDFRYWCEWIEWEKNKIKYSRSDERKCSCCKGKGYIKKEPEKDKYHEKDWKKFKSKYLS